MVRREKTNYIIQSVSHALDVLEQFTGESDELGVTELSKRLKLHKNNVFRVLATLEARGYIEQNRASENYRLGIQCVRLGQRFVTQVGLLRQARPVMTQMAKASRETVFISVMRAGAAIPIEAVEAEQPVRMISQVGEPLPLHASAAGKVHLAFADEELRAALPETLQRFNDKTIVDRDVLFQQLRRAAEAGYAMEDGEHVEDVRSVAVPVRDYTRAVVGALTVAGPAYRLTPAHLDSDVIPLMLNAGRELSARLGYDGTS